MNRLILAGVLAVATVGWGEARGTIVFSDDFESAPQVSSDPPRTGGVEADPVANIGSWILGHRADYAEQVTDYSPPGPQADSNYLRLSHASSSEAIAVFTAPQANDFTADFWVHVEHVGFRIFLRDAAGDIGGWLTWGEAAPGVIGYRSSGSTWEPTTAAYTLNTWQHVILDYNYDAVTPTMDITVDISSATGVPFYDASKNELAQIFFAGGDATGLSEYVDNVLVDAIPEPAAAALMGLGIVAGLLRQRRRKN